MPSLNQPTMPPSHSRTGAFETGFGRSVGDSNFPLLPTLDRYRLSCLLGRGGMAEVYLAAWQVAPQVVRPVVVKRLYSHFSDEQSLVRMFIDEARLVCQLDQENIVKTYEIGMIDDQLCIVMEYLEGQTLQQVARNAAVTLPVPLAVHIAAAVLAGLKYAHESRDRFGESNEIVHRDISPQNIFITNSGRVKILDFGIAKAKCLESRTSTGIVKGKFAYIAPEQASGQAVDGRADLFSLGVVLWEALAGKRLFKADGDAATLNATLKRDVPFLTSIRSEVPLDVAMVVHRALQRDPKKRYPTAAAMLDDLEKYLRRIPQRPTIDSLRVHMHACFGDEIRLQEQRVRDLLAQDESSNARPVGESQPPPSGKTIADAEGMPGSCPSLSPAVAVRTGLGSRFRWALLIGLGAITTLLCVLLWLDIVKRSSPVATSGSLDSVPARTLPQSQAASNESVVRSEPAVDRAPSVEPHGASQDPPVLASTLAAPAGRRILTKPSRNKPNTNSARLTSDAAAPTTSATSDLEFGLLTIDTTPWSIVSDKGQMIGTTPLIQAKLAAGTHLLSLRNPELGLETQYSVTIHPNQTVTRRIGLK